MAWINLIRRNILSVQFVVILLVAVWSLAYTAWVITGKDLEIILKTRFVFTDETFKLEKEILIQRYDNTSDLGETFQDAGVRVCTQQERRDHVKAMCSTIGNITDDVTKQTCGDLANDTGSGPCMLVDHVNKVAFCEIRKSGSSSGVSMMIRYGPYGYKAPDHFKKGQIHDFKLKADLGLKYEIYSEKLAEYKKFMIARHPFDRLISAYNDKLRMVDVSGRFKMIRLMVRNMYKEGQSVVDGWDSIDFDKVPDLNVTFHEFMRTLLNQKPIDIAQDEHWSSYGLICDPCRVHYDYIMRIESLHYDTVKFVQDVYQKKITDSPQVNVYRKNKSKNSKIVLSKYLNDYRKVLSDSEISKLIKLYFHDFSLYGYRFDPTNGEASCDIQTGTGEHCC